MTPGSTQRRALITGGSRGIGYATAERFAAAGVDVALVARSADRLAHAANRLEAATGRDAATAAIDLTASDAVYALSAFCNETGPPNYVICAAGVAKPARFEETPVDDFRALFEANVVSAVQTLEATLPHISRCDGPRNITLVSSGVGIVGMYGQSAYGASKFALRGLAEALRAELREQNIAVSICYPPSTDTDMLADALERAPAETKAVMTSARTLPAEKVAAAIYDGVMRGRFEITPGFEMTLLNRLHSIAKPMVFWAFDRAAAKGSRS